MSKQRVAVYPGVFDPLTLGHMDIIRRGAVLFDRLIVAVAINPAKQSLFTTDERLAMVRSGVGKIKDVKVDAYEGLTVEYVRRHGASILLRGLRQHSDFEYEYQLALTNRTISGVETIFVMADERVAYISSHLVREVAALGGDVSPLVPKGVLKALAAKLAATRHRPTVAE
ncbi:MAG: pantetheine-phosphate adenylyltransferase [Planctomycetota bacterium]|nr:pantetheine-phosphate adenylyltransferase [Planctomycetota bacterium]